MEDVTALFQAEVAGRRSTGFILVVALANAGGVIGFMPLLTLLLPVKIAGIAGDARIGLFTATVIAGAVAASASSILFGWLSDRSVARGGGRRGWVTVGLVALAASFLAVAVAATPFAIIAAIVFFQIAVNAVLGPLFAIMADEVPGSQMGVAGGLIALGVPLASAVAALIALGGVAAEGAQLAIIFAAILLCVVPLLRIPAKSAPASDSVETPLLGRDLAMAWTSRLLMQVAGNVLFLYLVYYFESIDPAGSTLQAIARLGQLLTVAYLIPLPVAVLIGRWSDRSGRRKPFLLATGLIAVVGLIGLALAESWHAAAVAFALYALGSACFLSLHSGFAMQLLPDPAHRGRDLGVLNLTNTLPALLGPLLTWLLATPRDFDAVMLTLAGLTLAGSVLVLGVRQRG